MRPWIWARPWAAALALGLGTGLLMLSYGKAGYLAHAEALAGDVEPALPPELAVLLQRRDPAAIRALMADWRAHHTVPSPGAGAEAGALSRGTAA